MAPLRSLLVLLILIGLVSAATAVAQAPVEWYTDTGGGGGALAGPAPHSTGGGAFAPTGTGPADVNLPPPEDMPSSVSPPAQAATASKPAVPRSSEPASPQATPAGAPAAADAQADSDAGTIGSLPFTGLELVVIVAAGLCLLVAGAALRPRPARR
jgi:hypothetical protein